MGVLRFLLRQLFSHLNQETANPSGGWAVERYWRRKQRSSPGGEWQEAPGKLSTLFSTGNTGSLGYLWSLSGGRREEKERQGLP